MKLRSYILFFFILFIPIFYICCKSLSENPNNAERQGEHVKPRKKRVPGGYGDIVIFLPLSENIIIKVKTADGSEPSFLNAEPPEDEEEEEDEEYEEEEDDEFEDEEEFEDDYYEYEEEEFYEDEINADFETPAEEIPEKEETPEKPESAKLDFLYESAGPFDYSEDFDPFDSPVPSEDFETSDLQDYSENTESQDRQNFLYSESFDAFEENNSFYGQLFMPEQKTESVQETKQETIPQLPETGSDTPQEENGGKLKLAEGEYLLNTTERFIVISGRITELDLTGLKCIQEIDASECPSLQALYCGGNNITRLILPQNSNLEKLNCEDNSIYELDLSKQYELVALNCRKNRLTHLDSSLCYSLKYFDCCFNLIDYTQMNELLDKLPKNTDKEWKGKARIGAFSKRFERNSIPSKDNILKAEIKGWRITDYKDDPIFSY